ncbi:MAG: TrkH family potassium uptake protein [Oscillospiraceae bacterium]|nr:TrkH family potassium uptake protein [Oscillospiraceae bacterium]
MNYPVVFNIIGWLLCFDGAFMLIPALTGLIYRERTAVWFLPVIAVCALIGGLMVLLIKPKKKTIYAREGYVIVAMSWLVMSLFGALPLFLSGSIPSYTDALFETVSGFTTTGASILSSVEDMPKCMLMWRSFTHWVGGMGVLVFVMAFIPLSGGSNMHIMKAESTGPSVSKLMPGVKTTALVLYTIYFVMTLLQVTLHLFGGMTPFEAINTSFATAGTGGFGFRNDSMASFSSYNRWVMTIFMLLFSLSFSSYYFLIKGKFRNALSLEIRTFFAVVIVSVAIVVANIRDMFPTLRDAVEQAAFTVSSIISTTGFTTTDFDRWPELSKTILVFLMFIGACAGSTGGGVKISRLVILFKGMHKELATMIHPKQLKKITMDGSPVSHEVVRSVNVYMVGFVLVFSISMLILSFDGYDFETNFTAVAATINNIGPGLSAVGPAHNFAFFSVPAKLVLIFDMIAGRLELYPMLLLLSPSTWKK